MSDEYKAREHYQKADVAGEYEERRFASWHGRLAHRAEMRAIRRAIERYFSPGGKVLDLPCGTGRLFGVYAAGDYQVTGCDISDEMLAIAQKAYADSDRFSFIKNEAERLPFDDDAFDYLVSFRFMSHLPTEVRRVVTSEMLRVTKGALVVNYDLLNWSPMMMVNRMFRSWTCSPHLLKRRELEEELDGMGVKVCEMRPLSWYDRSATVVVMRKRDAAV